MKKLILSLVIALFFATPVLADMEVAPRSPRSIKPVPQPTPAPITIEASHGGGSSAFWVLSPRVQDLKIDGDKVSFLTSQFGWAWIEGGTKDFGTYHVLKGHGKIYYQPTNGQVMVIGEN